MTGGQYFRATGNRVLEEVFSEIDKLEKTQMDVRHFSPHRRQLYDMGMARICVLHSRHHSAILFSVQFPD